MQVHKLASISAFRSMCPICQSFCSFGGFRMIQETLCLDMFRFTRQRLKACFVFAPSDKVSFYQISLVRGNDENACLVNFIRKFCRRRVYQRIKINVCYVIEFRTLLYNFYIYEMRMTSISLKLDF
jgi:hypothetical protein